MLFQYIVAKTFNTVLTLWHILDTTVNISRHLADIFPKKLKS